jgi:serine/threonine-protein kinase PknG
VLADAASREAADWRVTWYQGLHSLALADHGAARAALDAVVEALPGELAPKLALGLAAEAAADYPAAARYFQIVWTVDRSYVSAGFGLARTRLKDGDKAGAVDALGGVPQSSSQYTAAQVAALRIRLSPAGNQLLASATDLHDASRRLSGLRLDPAVHQRLTTEVLLAALARIDAGLKLDGGPLLGVEPTERAVRFGLERSYRAQARQAPDVSGRVALVDMANAIRPRTWS